MDDLNRRWTVIEVDRLIDGLIPGNRGRHVIVLEGDTIRSMGHPEEVDVPTGPEVDHLQIPPNSTILPGLIDTHTHLTMNGSGVGLPVDLESNDGVLLMQAAVSARIHLEAGITTVVDAGARGRVAFELVEAARLGLVQTPRLLVAGRPITRTGGHAWTMGEEADGVNEVSHAARQMLKDGADFIKIMATGGGTPGTYPHLPSYRTEELAVAATEAHENGRIAVAHCSSTEGHRRCLAAGIDIIYHCHFYEPDGTLKFNDEVAKQLADSPVHVNPTLWINGGRVASLRSKAEQQGLTADEERLLQLRADRYAGQRENVGLLAQHGVKMIAGTDAGFAIYPFGDIVTELEEMVACGMSAGEVLLSATRIAAEALRIDDLTGSLAPGMKADLLVVDGDPGTDIASLRNVQAVISNGAVVRNNGGLIAQDINA